MSAIATFVRLPATAPTGASEPIEDYVSGAGSEVLDFGWSGYVVPVAIAFLDEKGFAFEDGDAGKLSDHCGGYNILLTEHHRDEHLRELSAARFDEAELEAFFEDFCATSGEGMSAPLLGAIAAIQRSLEVTSRDTVVLISVF